MIAQRLLLILLKNNSFMRLRLNVILKIIIGFAVGFVLFSVVTSFRSIPSAKAQPLPIAQSDVHITSCGISAYAFAVAGLQSHSLYRVDQELQEISDGRFGILSLMEISQALRISGLHVRLIRSNTVFDEMRSLADSEVAIVHLDSFENGHFIAVQKFSKSEISNSFRVLIGSKGTEILHEHELKSLVKARASGLMLIANSGSLLWKITSKLGLSSHIIKSKEMSRDFNNDERNLVLSSINISKTSSLECPSRIVFSYDPSCGVARVPIAITNKGEEDVNIVQLKGSCKCFVGSDMHFPVFLKARNKVVIHANFSIEKMIPRNDVFVAFELDGPNRAVVPITIRFQANKIAPPFLLTQHVSLGIVDASAKLDAFFYLLGEVDHENRSSSNIKCLNTEGVGGKVECVAIKKSQLYGKEYNVDVVRFRIDKCKPGFNSVTASIVTVAGNVLPIQLDAYILN